MEYIFTGRTCDQVLRVHLQLLRLELEVVVVNALSAWYLHWAPLLPFRCLLRILNGRTVTLALVQAILGPVRPSPRLALLPGIRCQDPPPPFHSLPPSLPTTVNRPPPNLPTVVITLYSSTIETAFLNYCTITGQLQLVPASLANIDPSDSSKTSILSSRLVLILKVNRGDHIFKWFIVL